MALGTCVSIDISTDIYSPSLWSRRIWERLFRLVGAERFLSLDCFLCDLRIIEDLIDKGTLTFWWRFHSTGWTDLTTFDQQDDNCYRIDVASDFTKITLSMVLVPDRREVPL